MRVAHRNAPDYGIYGLLDFWQNGFLMTSPLDGESENRRSFIDDIMVGLGGLEPPTSPLSGARSSHLSYRPKSRNNFEILTGGLRRAQLQLLRSMLWAKNVSLYCTKPTFGAGVLPSGDSLMVPN